MAITLTTVASTRSVSSAVAVAVNIADVTDFLVISVGSGPSTVTINSTVATLSVRESSAVLDLWFGFSGTTGAITVASTKANASSGHNLIASVWTGVDTTTPVGSTAKSGAPAASSISTLLVNSSANTFTVGAAAFNQTAQTTAAVSSGTGMIRDVVVGAGGTASDNMVAFGHMDGASPNVTLAWNITASTTWRAVGLTLNPASTGGGARQQIYWMQ